LYLESYQIIRYMKLKNEGNEEHTLSFL
jgi:hypothetical protein